MVKMVMMDFYSRRKQAVKKVGIQCLHWLPMVIAIINMLRDEDNKLLISEVMIILIQIMFLGVTEIIHEMYPNYLPSGMCLIPFNREEKKKYLWTSFWLKVGITSGLHFLFNLVIVILGNVVWWKAILLVSCLLIFNILSGLRFQNPAGTMEENLKKASLLEAFLVVLSVTNYALLIFFSIEKNELGTSAIFLWIMGISIAIQMICAVKSFSKCPEYMEAGSTVENLWKKQ